MAMKDGLIDDPRSCRFDFKTIECKGGDSASCLTTAQVATAQTITNPVIHPKTGETIFPGLALGTELGWGLRIGGPEPQFFGPEYFKYVFYKDPNWDWRTFDLEAAFAIADRTDYRMLNATDPDLKRFQQRGGKLLLYHGWSDANFSAPFTIDYYESMRAWLALNGSGSGLVCFLRRGWDTAGVATDRMCSTPWRRSNSGSKTATRQGQSLPHTLPMVRSTEPDPCAPIHRSRSTEAPGVSTRQGTSRASCRNALAREEP